MQDRNGLASIFDALGHPRRITILSALQNSGADGLKFGDLARLTKMSESNLTHHIRMMKKGGVISSIAKGRYTVLTLNQQKIKRAFMALGILP